MNIAPITCTISDATKVSGLSRRSLYRLLKSGALTPRKYGSRTLINVNELHDFLANLPKGNFSHEN